MKIKMIALKATKYAGRRYAVGDFIMARGSKDARVLEVVKIAHRAPVVATKQAAEPQRAPDITYQHLPVFVIDEPDVDVTDEAPAAADQDQEADEPAAQEAAAQDAHEIEEVTEKPAVVRRNSRARGKARSAE